MANLIHKVGENANIGHFGYVQFANQGNQCLTVESLLYFIVILKVK